MKRYFFNSSDYTCEPYFASGSSGQNLLATLKTKGKSKLLIKHEALANIRLPAGMRHG